MKNEKDEAKEYFERNILLVIAVTVVGLFLDWLTVDLFTNVSPWASATAVPGVVITLQALWLIVNPYVIVYEDRFEIKQNLFYNKQFYFLDIKNIISKNNSKSLFIEYNDGEIEALKLFGIRASHREALYKKLQEKLTISLQKRETISA